MDGPVRDFAGARVTVMGIGLFGGGAGVVEWLASRGADVLATDLARAEALAPAIERLRPLVDRGAVRLRLGEHNVSDFTDCDLVVANPAAPKPWENRFLRAAGAAGVPVTTEIRLVVERLPAREHVIGVTGSAGKSTTSAMIAHALRASGAVAHLGGNIGGSLLGGMDSIGADDFVVLELSSFMLHWLGKGQGWPSAPAWAPGVAVVTNIAPNHLDWHGSMEHYEASKRRMVADQSAGDVALLGEGVASWKNGVGGDAIVVGEAERAALRGVRLPLPGAHNRENAALALAAVGGAVRRAGGEWSEARLRAAARALESFEPLAHRLQCVARWRRAAGEREIAAYNDSKCTTPEATVRAVDALLEDGAAAVHLICGGYDKQADMSPLVEACARCRRVYTIGTTGPRIAAAVRARSGAVEECGDLGAAVRAAVGRAEGGSVVALSPGCASWDQFVNFEERGRVFGERVLEAVGGAGFVVEWRGAGLGVGAGSEKIPNGT